MKAGSRVQNRRKLGQGIAFAMLAAGSFLVTGCYQNYLSDSSTTGSLNSSSSLYTLPGSSGSTITLLPSSTTVTPGGTITLSASGGTPPYIYTIYSGGGAISGADIFTAGQVIGDVTTIQVEDQISNLGYVEITTEADNGNTTTSSGGLTLIMSESTAYYGDQVELSASGGAAPYSFEITNGVGNLSGTNFTAPLATTIADFQVTDNDGNVATASLPISSKSPASGIVQLGALQNVLLAFDMPNDEIDYSPTFIFAGAGTSFDFGSGVNEGAGLLLTTFAPPSATAAIILPNFNAYDPDPYTGTLTLSGTAGGSNVFNFCIEAGKAISYLQEPTASQGSTATTSAFTFSSLDSRMSGGTTAQSVWIDGINNQSSAEAVTVILSTALENHNISDCSSYGTYQLSSQSTY